MSVKYMGTKTLVDEDGNEFTAQATSVQGADKGFTKVWIADFMAKLEIIGGQKLKVAFWLIEHTDKNNQINYSQRQIAQMSGIGLSTVRDTMKALQQADLIRRVRQVYMLNAETLSKTYSATARQAIITIYETEGEDKRELTVQEKIDNLSKQISRLNERKKQLKRTIQNELNELEEKENEAYVEMARLQQSITP